MIFRSVFIIEEAPWINPQVNLQICRIQIIKKNSNKCWNHYTTKLENLKTKLEIFMWILFHIKIIIKCKKTFTSNFL